MSKELRGYTEMSRRSFLSVMAMTAGSLVIGIQLQPLAESEARAAGSDPFVPNAWIKIHPSGIYEFVLDKTEMGQGVMTSLATLVCEELDLDLDQLTIVFAGADDRYKTPGFGMQITGGSTSVKTSFIPLREAAASTRFLLVSAAAKRLQVRPEEVQVDRGMLFAKQAPSQKLSFADVCGDASLMPLPKKIVLKDPTRFRLIGKSQKRVDAASKVCGTAMFGIDAKPKDAWCAYVIRSPFLGGTVKTFDPTEAKKQPGVKAVVQIPRGVAVVAERWWLAKNAADHVRVEWDKGQLGDKNHAQIYQVYQDALQNESGKIFTDRGNLKNVSAQVKTWVDAEITIPFAPHATMEPQNGFADVKTDGADLIGPTQGPGLARDIVARNLGFAREQVRVTQTFIGGGFGRRLPQDYLEDAAAISAAVKQPVQMVYTREDDMRHDYFRPGNVHRLRAGLDAQGSLISWQHKMVGPSIMTQLMPLWGPSNMPAWLPKFISSPLANIAADYTAWRNDDGTSTEGAADMEYAVPNMQMEYVIKDVGIPVGFWRSVGHSFTGFVVETFIDMCAHAAAQDPIQFRLDLLQASPRRAAVLKEVAKLANWSTRAEQGRFLGVAQVYSFSSYAAHIAEVEVKDRQIKVKKIFVACDCGLVVNPDQVRAQIESAIIYGCRQRYTTS